MRRGSIAVNLFWYSLVWLVLALAVTAFLLSGLYSRALDNTLQSQLEFNLETLVGVGISTGDMAIPQGSLADPRFSRPASGWYWEIRDSAGNASSFSASLIGSIMPQLDTGFDADNMRSGIVTDNFGTSIRLVERQITLNDKKYWIAVSGNLDEIRELVAQFRGQTFIVLGAVGAMLAIMSGIVARFALRPIGRLRRAVEAVREGEANQVQGQFPAEIAPLADEVNELLRSNSEIIERARNQVGNLAHGLKTPLAVLRNEAAGGKSALANAVMSETDKMSGLVSLYLDRSRLAARTAVIGRKTDAAETVQRLVRVMQKLNATTKLLLTVQGDVAWFRGEEGDLEEMAGNLIDNACKWSKSSVAIQLLNAPDRSQLIFLVEDDGSGLSAEEIKAVQKRGVRLDEKIPGSGLGLDIVKELVDIYGGELQMGRSQALGGLRVELRLPATKRGKP